jgi:hypothetical protein
METQLNQTNVEILSTKEISDYLTGIVRWHVGKQFPTSKLNREGKIAVIRNSRFQTLATNYYVNYLNKLNLEILEGFDSIFTGGKLTGSDAEKRLAGAKEWKADCEWRLDLIQNQGFEAYVIEAAKRLQVSMKAFKERQASKK